jgi:hypothetical protein
MNILALVPGGQTKGASPSEILIKEVARQRPDWKIYIINFTFDDLSIFKYNFSNIDLVWSDMDGKEVIQVGALLKKKYGMKFYAHGEWVPPYRVLEGYSERYLTETDLSMRPCYLKMLEAMKQADLVSFGRRSESGGSFNWVKDKFGIEFENAFVRYNYVKRYPFKEVKRKYSVATIARASDPKKRVVDTIKALSLIKPTPEFDIVGAEKDEIKANLIRINCLGKFDSDEKIEIYRNASVAVQHWSGIPPAEAITQFCPVVSYGFETMKHNYGDTLYWAEPDNIMSLAKTILYVLTHPKEVEIKVKESYKKLENSEIKVNYVDVRAKEVISKIEDIL